jgi:hypothetical protein
MNCAFHGGPVTTVPPHLEEALHSFNSGVNRPTQKATSERNTGQDFRNKNEWNSPRIDKGYGIYRSNYTQATTATVHPTAAIESA